MDASSILSLIGSMGPSAAAVFVTWFLTTAFLKHLSGFQEEIIAIAKEKGNVIRDDAVALTNLSKAIDSLTILIKKVDNSVDRSEVFNRCHFNEKCHESRPVAKDDPK